LPAAVSLGLGPTGGYPERLFVPGEFLGHFHARAAAHQPADVGVPEGVEVCHATGCIPVRYGRRRKVLPHHHGRLRWHLEHGLAALLALKPRPQDVGQVTANRLHVLAAVL
jgi:hypothetical protein